MLDPAKIKLAVALLQIDQRVVIIWNPRWKSFTLPMTKIRSGPMDGPSKAAIRAAAECLEVPCRVTSADASATRQLQLSSQDGDLKDYEFEIVPVEVHPDFTDWIRFDGVLLAEPDKLLTGEYKPLSPSVKPLLQTAIMDGLIATKPLIV